ncbi:MAG TPA: polyprenyl synthetase family protein [Actinotalea caeni]|uniref:polyprenyl synthetase family protein n=1 Tax=Actinotalea caeni TaxID=1348467 RepID=UPI002B4AF519|nr:polyprenyl synthetase family protein [Actinotalea caeni]HLV55776.1 polyprenyl synthetase family protein [Actinotalea caeni]
MSAPTQPVGVADADTDAVDACLEDFFARRIPRSHPYGEPYRRLWRSIRDAARGGKRLRPALLLLAYRHVAQVEEGELPRDAVAAAAALELLHTAFVVHDDVIDHDLVRRGRPNVAGQAVVDAIDAGARSSAARDYGTAAAILAGDLLLSAAHTLVAGLDVPADRRRALLELLDECVMRTAAGELVDVWSAVATVPDEAGVLAVVTNKTAAYTFGAPLQAGAILAGADHATLTGLRTAGIHLGVAYQLRDDVLGVFGDESTTGKSTIGDLREGKETLLIAHARTDTRWRDVEHLFGRPDLEESEARLLRSVIAHSGALARVEQRIAAELARAHEMLRTLGMPHPLLDTVLTITDPAGGRRR